MHRVANGVGIYSADSRVTLSYDNTAPTLTATMTSNGTAYTDGTWQSKDVIVALNYSAASCKRVFDVD